MAPSILLAADLAPTAELGQPLSDLLGRLRVGGVLPSEACGDVLDSWAASGPLAAAARSIAREADKSGAANSYHNPGHTRDVAVIWATLDRLADRIGCEPLTEEDRLAGLCAALGHDLWHDGVGNFVNRQTSDGVAICERWPFRLESISAKSATSILEEQGAPPRAVAIVRAAILATDVVDGYAALRASLASGASANAISSYPGLQGLGDEITLRIACMLRDADLMQSAGLTALDHDTQSEALGRELGASLNATTSEHFFRETVGGRFYSQAGQVFQPRLDALRALNHLRAAANNAGPLSRTAQDIAG